MVSFVTQKDLVPDAIAALERHGCVILSCDLYSEVVFPEGTVKEAQWPVVWGDAYSLTLPDGYQCEVRYIRHLESYIIFYAPNN